MPQYREIDEYTHEPTEEANYSESMYLNFYDCSLRVGGFLRVANRPNEGHAEVTNAIYMPGGEVLFSYQRPSIKSNAAFEAAGMAFHIVEPFKRLRVEYEGEVLYLTDPMALENPEDAFAQNPWFSFLIRLQVESFGPVQGLVDRGSQVISEVQFWKEHYEQLVRIKGEMKFEDNLFVLEGLGLRDHSWGPRSWQSPQYYRWLSAAFDEQLGFGLMYLVSPTGLESRKGFIYHEGKAYPLKSIEIETDFVGPARYHSRINLELTTALERFNIQGRVLSLLPLRNRRQGKVTRLSEGMTEWRWRDRVGYGLSEYLDQVDDETVNK